MIRLILCLLIPLCAAIRINLGGALTPGEVLLLVVSPFFLADVEKVWRVPLARKLFYFMMAYLAGQILTDLVRGTVPLDMVRGWARVGMMAAAFLLTGALIGTNQNRIAAFALGGSFAAIAGMLLMDPTELSAAFGSVEGYKFVLGGSTSICAFLLAGYGRRFGWWVTLAPVAAGILGFLMNCRSLAGITLMAWALSWLIRFKPGQLRVFQPRIFLTLAGIAVAAGVILSAYSYMAPRGMLGQAAKEKFDMQAGGTGGKFSVFSGRDELSFSWPKIVESPIIGWGSWVKDRAYVMRKCLEMGMSWPATKLYVSAKGGLIPSHSHLFGAWLEGGIVGAAFWATIWLLTVRAVLLDGFAIFGPVKPLLLFLYTNFAWDILFSPFGGERRIWNGFLIWVLVVVTLYLQREKQRSRELGQAQVRREQLAQALA
jgi:hypothetical protein